VLDVHTKRQKLGHFMAHPGTLLVLELVIMVGAYGHSVNQGG
jgi:hypothetical protein